MLINGENPGFMNESQSREREDLSVLCNGTTTSTATRTALTALPTLASLTATAALITLTALPTLAAFTATRTERTTGLATGTGD